MTKHGILFTFSVAHKQTLSKQYLQSVKTVRRKRQLLPTLANASGCKTTFQQRLNKVLYVDLWICNDLVQRLTILIIENFALDAQWLCQDHASENEWKIDNDKKNTNGDTRGEYVIAMCQNDMEQALECKCSRITKTHKNLHNRVFFGRHFNLSATVSVFIRAVDKGF